MFIAWSHSAEFIYFFCRSQCHGRQRTRIFYDFNDGTLGKYIHTCESEMNGIIWIFTIWFHCDKLVLKPANQVCNGTQIRCALGHSTAIENTSDPKKAVTLLCSPPALSQWPVQFELSVLFIRCSHNCHLHCDECYTLDLTSCVSWGFQWNHFFAFGQW